MAEQYIGSTDVSDPNFGIKSEQEDAKFRKEVNRQLIHSAFPTQGKEKRADEGSQSKSPMFKDVP